MEVFTVMVLRKSHGLNFKQTRFLYSGFLDLVIGGALPHAEENFSLKQIMGKFIIINSNKL